MLDLIILRHAKTEKGRPGLADRDRRLLPQGRTAATDAGSWLARHRLVPSVVLCSDSARTRETVDLLTKALDARPERFDLPELYEADEEDYAGIVSVYGGRSSCVLLVGHNPAVSRFVSRWAESSVNMKPGALAVLTATVERADQLGAAGDLSVRRLYLPEAP